MATEVEKKSQENIDEKKSFQHFGKLLTVCLIVAILIIAGFIIYYLYTPESPYHTYTILNEDKKMEAYPINASRGEDISFYLGLGNNLEEDLIFTIIISKGDNTTILSPYGTLNRDYNYTATNFILSHEKIWFSNQLNMSFYETGKKIGQTDVILRLNDKTPFRLYGGYENTGNINAGKSRFLAGLNWGNIFRLDHRFNYQYMAAPSIKGWQGHSYSYVAPLPCRHILKVFGSYVRSISDRDLYRDIVGKSWYVGARYYVPFRVGKIKNEFHLGYDFKRTNNFLSYQTKMIYNTYMDVSQFTVGLKGIYEYQRGETAWNFIGYLSPGDMTKYNETIYFQVEKNANQANYFYFDLYLDQTVYLPYDFSWVFTSEYQYSSGRLLPSEQLSLGGYYTVRGYQENDVISDRGILIKNEIRSPVINISRDHKKKSEVIYLFFCDFGWASKIDQNILDKDTAILASLGLGLRYNLMNYINLQLDYGFQLNRVHRLADSSSSRSRAHLGLVLSY